MEKKSFNEQVQDWLDTPLAERSLEVGATLMLQANKNRILHQNVLKRNNFDKIEYELKKYLGDKYQKCTQETVTKLEKVVTENAETQKPDTTGKREDHDSLPTEIQALFSRNLEIYPRMRSIHERLKVLSGEGFTACDRLPHLKELLKMDEELRENWDKYDNYDPTKAIQKPKVENTQNSNPLTVKEVQKHRTYLSRAAKEIPEKRKNGKTESADNQLKEAQVRYDKLILDGQSFDEKMIEDLKGIGIDTEKKDV